MGRAILLFFIGIEFSVEKLLKVKGSTLVAALVKLAIPFVVMYNLAALLQLDPFTSLLIASMFSVSSTALMITLLAQKKLMNKKETPALLSMLIIEDLVAIALLTIISAYKIGTNVELLELIGAMLFSSIALLLAYFGIKWIMKHVAPSIIAYGSEGMSAFVSLFIALLFSFLASILGLSGAIGAFLAGSLVISLPHHDRFERAIKPFGTAFASFFFISMGMLINPFVLFDEGLVTIILLGAAVLIGIISAVVAGYFFGFPGSSKSAAFMGAAMAVYGEFSLLIAKQGSGISSFDTIGLASTAVLVSAVVSSYLLGVYPSVAEIAKKKTPSSIITLSSSGATYAGYVLAALEEKQALAKVVHDEFELIKATMKLELIVLALYSFFILFIRKMLPLEIRGGTVIAATALAVFLTLPLLFRILHFFWSAMRESTKRVIRKSGQVFGTSIAVNIILGIVCYVVSVATLPILLITGFEAFSPFMWIPFVVIGIGFHIQALRDIHAALKERK